MTSPPTLSRRHGNSQRSVSASAIASRRDWLIYRSFFFFVPAFLRLDISAERSSAVIPAQRPAASAA
jgi:hypothetical protein